MVMRVVSAVGVLVRGACIQFWAEPGQRVGVQEGAVPAAGRREACGGRGVHDLSLGPLRMSVLEARAPWAQGLESARWQGVWREGVRTGRL